LYPKHPKEKRQGVVLSTSSAPVNFRNTISSLLGEPPEFGLFHVLDEHVRWFSK